MSVLEEFNGNITEYEYQKRQERKQERKRKRNAKIIQALEDVKAEIEDYDVLRNFVGTSEAFKLGVTKGLDLSAEIIDRKIAEVKGDKE